MSLFLTPYRPMTSLREAMDRLFETSFVPALREENWTLPLDVQAREDEFVLTASVPGFKAEEIEISVQEDSVSLRAERKSERTEKQNGYLLREIRGGSFARQITLPAPVEAGKVEAGLENGLLTVRLPKAESAKVKTITVKAK